MPAARALYPFQGQDASELSFAEGEILTVWEQNGALLPVTGRAVVTYTLMSCGLCRRMVDV